MSSNNPKKKLYGQTIKRNLLEGTCSGCLGRRDSEAVDEAVLLCDGVGCCREYHIGCTDPLLQDVPEDEFFCPDCDPVGTTRLLELYFDECADERAEFKSSREYVMSMVEDTMGTESGGDPGEHASDANSSGSTDNLNSKKRKADEISSIVVSGDGPPISEIGRMSELHNAAMDDTAWRGDGNKIVNGSSNRAKETIDREFLIGKIVKVYCTKDNQYHIGRIIDWRSAVAPGTDPELIHEQFLGSGIIASTEFLVRFAGGVNGRKKTLLQWIILEEHSCAVSSSVVMALKDKGRGMNGWKPAQLMLRSCLELVPIRNLLSTRDHYGLVTFFGVDTSIYLDLDSDAVDFSSRSFHLEMKKKTTKTKLGQSSSRLTEIVMATTLMELGEQERTFSWYSLPLNDRLHFKALTLVDEYSSELLPDNEKSGNPSNRTTSEGFPLPKLCPLIQHSLDKQWIASRLGDTRSERSLDSIASMKVKMCRPSCITVAAMNKIHKRSL